MAEAPVANRGNRSQAGMGMGVESFSLFPGKSHLICVSGGFVRRMDGREHKYRGLGKGIHIN